MLLQCGPMRDGDGAGGEQGTGAESPRVERMGERHTRR